MLTKTYAKILRTRATKQTLKLLSILFIRLIINDLTFSLIDSNSILFLFITWIRGRLTSGLQFNQLFLQYFDSILQLNDLFVFGVSLKTSGLWFVTFAFTESMSLRAMDSSSASILSPIITSLSRILCRKWVSIRTPQMALKLITN